MYNTIQYDKHNNCYIIHGNKDLPHPPTAADIDCIQAHLSIQSERNYSTFRSGLRGFDRLDG